MGNQKLVIPTDKKYFLNEDRDSVTEGRYKILGKVSKICYGENETINLLRNTAFSLFKVEKINEITKLFNNDELNVLLNEIEIENEIKSPTMMIIPIAMYI